jgi:hypothetical protein
MGARQATSCCHRSNAKDTTPLEIRADNVISRTTHMTTPKPMGVITTRTDTCFIRAIS